MWDDDDGIKIAAVRRFASTIVPGLLALAALLLLAAPVGAAPAAHASGKKGAKRSHRCKRGRVAVRIGKRRPHCRKLRLKRSALRGPRTPAAALKAATKAIAAAAHGKGSKHVGRGIKHLLGSRGLRNLRRLARQVGAPAALGSSAVARASAISESVSLPGGWEGHVEVDPASEEFSLGAYKGGEGASLTMRFPEVHLESCPDAGGATAVRGGFTFALDAIGDAKQGDGSKIFIHYALREKSKSEAHTGDDAHLHDFDFRASAYQHAQVGFKDKSGKVLRTNPPALATVSAAARYTAPFKEIKTLKATIGSKKDTKSGEAAIRSMLETWGRNSPSGQAYTISDGAWEAMGNKAVAAPLAWTLIDLISTYDGLTREQDAHWLVDCLSIDAETASPEIAAGSTAPLFVSLRPRHGEKVAEAKVTAGADVGKVAPASAKGGKQPVRFDYTAPGEGWKLGHVKLRAVSKQGVGTTTLEFEAPHHTFTLRFGVALDHRYLGGDDGVGSATWRASLEALLLGAPSEELTGIGPVPFGWSTYFLEDNDIPMVCQAGGYGHVDEVGVGSDPGSFEVTDVALVEGEPQEDEVTFRFSAPLDHYTTTFHPDGTTCGESSNSASYRYLDGYRSWLGLQPGVRVTRPANPADLAGQTYTIKGFQPGAGAVEARRALSEQKSFDTYSESLQITLELIRQEDG